MKDNFLISNILLALPQTTAHFLHSGIAFTDFALPFETTNFHNAQSCKQPEDHHRRAARRVRRKRKWSPPALFLVYLATDADQGDGHGQTEGAFETRQSWHSIADCCALGGVPVAEIWSSSEITRLTTSGRDSTSTSPTKTPIDLSPVRSNSFLDEDKAMTDGTSVQDVFQYVENKLWWYSI
jgi:hypothetical protein